MKILGGGGGSGGGKWGGGSKLHQHLISSAHRNLASSEHDFTISNVNDSVWLQIHNHNISLIHSGEAVSLDGANSSFNFTQTGKVSD